MLLDAHFGLGWASCFAPGPFGPYAPGLPVLGRAHAHMRTAFELWFRERSGRPILGLALMASIAFAGPCGSLVKTSPWVGTDFTRPNGVCLVLYGDERTGYIREVKTRTWTGGLTYECRVQEPAWYQGLWCGGPDSDPGCPGDTCTQ